MPKPIEELQAPTVEITKSGLKHDLGKPDLSLLPAEGLEHAAYAFMDGLHKYGRYNYREGMEWTRLISAIQRHILAFNKGEDFAPDSKVHHLGHAIAGCMMLLDYYYNNLGIDNRRSSCNTKFVIE